MIPPDDTPCVFSVQSGQERGADHQAGKRGGQRKAAVHLPLADVRAVVQQRLLLDQAQDQPGAEHSKHREEQLDEAIDVIAGVMKDLPS